MSDDSRSAEIKTGIFVLIALAVLVVGSLWIVGSTRLRGRQSEYHIRMKDSSGIRAGDRVRLAGVDVGRVQDVGLVPGDAWPVTFRVSLDARVALSADGSAYIASAGLLGSRFLQIDPGSAGAPPLGPGGTLTGKETAGIDGALEQVDAISGEVMALLAQLRGTVDEVSGEILPVIRASERFLSEENAENFAALLTSARETMEATGPQVTELVAELGDLTDKVDRSIDEIPELARQLSSLAEDVQVAFGPDGSRLARVLEAAESSLASAEGALAFVDDNRSELEAALRDLRDVTGNLKQFSQEIKERPFSLVRIKGHPDRRPGEGVEGAAP